MNLNRHHDLQSRSHEAANRIATATLEMPNRDAWAAMLTAAAVEPGLNAKHRHSLPRIAWQYRASTTQPRSQPR
jgi:hypothetical protein